MTEFLDETIKQFEKYVEEYEKIIVLDSDNSQVKGLFEHFLKYIDKDRVCINTLIIVVNDTDIRTINSGCQTVNICLSRKEFMLFMDIYNMYEFSDKITYLSDKCEYPSLINYVSTGMFSENEFFEALMR